MRSKKPSLIKNLQVIRTNHSSSAVFWGTSFVGIVFFMIVVWSMRQLPAGVQFLLQGILFITFWSGMMYKISLELADAIREKKSDPKMGVKLTMTDETFKWSPESQRQREAFFTDMGREYIDPKTEDHQAIQHNREAMEQQLIRAKWLSHRKYGHGRSIKKRTKRK